MNPALDNQHVQEAVTKMHAAVDSINHLLRSLYGVEGYDPIKDWRYDVEDVLSAIATDLRDAGWEIYEYGQEVKK